MTMWKAFLLKNSIYLVPASTLAPFTTPTPSRQASLSGISAEHLGGAEGKTVFPLEDMSQ